MSLSESEKFNLWIKNGVWPQCGTHAVPKNRMCEAEDFPIKAVKNSYNRNSGKTKIIFVCLLQHFSTFFQVNFSSIVKLNKSKIIGT